jgi:hypothetical protein
VTLRADGRPREMTVFAADGEVVEHRTAGGVTAERFLRHIANARLYVDAINVQEKARAAGKEARAG